MTAHAVDEYRQRLDARRATRAQLDRQDRSLAIARLVTFGVALLLIIMVWRGTVSQTLLWLLIVPVVVFLWLLQRHDRVLTARGATDRGIAFYERGLARIEDRWAGGGATGEDYADPEHLYAGDLDLFGKGSLFELLSTARTTAGEETIAAWLKAAALPREIAARHEAVRELTPAIDLRETLAVTAEGIKDRVLGGTLVGWGEAPPILDASARIPAIIVTIAILGALTWFLAGGSVAPLVVALAALLGVRQRLGTRVERVLRTADLASRELAAVQVALIHLEERSFSAAKLTALQHELESGDQRASTAIAALARLVERHDWAHNLLFTPIAAILFWDAHLAWAVEAWRARHGRGLLTWLRVVGDFEALSSLATYAFEHPDDPYPTIAVDDIRFEGLELGHPLLPAATMVRNDVSLGPDTRQLLVVSGSNMSGKSTLLRTVGINTVLALAGAPVRAHALRLSPLAIGATLRIQDSLQEGRSRFYAEITRIRKVSDLSRTPWPVLFLLDELFHGTNSHDRVVGATGVLRQLLDRGAIGLITTHDLAVTAVTTALGARAENVHFEEWFEGDEMKFDYLMKPGPVTRSNALALMRAVGLEVDAPNSRAHDDTGRRGDGELAR